MEQKESKVFWKSKGFIYGVIIFFTVGIVGSALDDSKEKANVNNLATEPTSQEESIDSGTQSIQMVRSGDEAKLYAGDETENIMVTVSEEAFDKMLAASNARDSEGLFELLRNGEAFMVSRDTKVLVIDVGFGKRKVRILEGENEKKAGWVIAEFVVKDR